MNNKTQVIAQEIPLAQIVFDRIHPANRIENDTVLVLKKHFQITKDNVLAVIPVEGTDYFRPLDDTVNKDKIANKLQVSLYQKLGGCYA